MNHHRNFRRVIVCISAALMSAGPLAGQNAPRQTPPVKKVLSAKQMQAYRHETRLTAHLNLSTSQIMRIDSLNDLYTPRFREILRTAHARMTPVEKAQFRVAIKHAMAAREQDFRGLLSGSQRATYDANKAGIAAARLRR